MSQVPNDVVYEANDVIYGYSTVPVDSGPAIPPAYDTTWCNDHQAATDALIILGLPTDPAGPDYQRMLVQAEAACHRISQHLDRLTPIPGVAVGAPPAPLRVAHANVTVELWRRKDAPSGIANSWSPDTTERSYGADPLAGSYHLIDPYKARWGLG